jgi:hypothetical protein
MRRRVTLASADLVLVTVLLTGYGSTDWAWLGGPVSALAIWFVDCSKRGPTPRPSPWTTLRTRPGTAPSE